MLKHVLNCRIAHTSIQRRRGDGNRTGHASVPNRLSRHIVLGQLINERARHNVIEEPVDLRDQVTGGSLLPPCPPKNCEYFNIPDQWAISIRKLRGYGRGCFVPNQFLRKFSGTTRIGSPCAG